MDVEVGLRNKVLYKVLLVTLRVIPMLLAFCAVCNNILCFFSIDVTIFSFIGGVSVLPLLFLYLASYVFRFCEYHRMFLHYILISDLLNIFDMFIGVPVSVRGLFGIHCLLVGGMLFGVLYLYRKERCGK